MKNILTAIVLAVCFTAPAARAAQTDSGDKTYEQMRLLIDVLGYIQDNYVDDIPTQKLVYGAAEGMVHVLDPFSQFLEPELNREMKTETEGQFGGVGIRLVVKDDWLTVMTPMPGTPAYRKGILPNDRISEIDGMATKDMDMDDAMKRMHGAPGTKLKLRILRGPDDSTDKPDVKPPKEIDVEIERELIKIESVVTRKVEGGVGYIRIVEFSAKTVDDLSEALHKLTREGMTSLVLDLRNNPGGLMSSAVETSSLFLGESKLVVYTQGRKPESRQDFRAGVKAPYASLPVVVLMNAGSASAAEIVAGALQDHKRALVVGERSYGKASVQSLIPLSDGSGLRLTVAHYYTPLGRMIHRSEKNPNWGIMPDIPVNVPPDVEAKLYEQWETIYALDKKPKSLVKADEMVRDEALERAEELLKARDVLGVLKSAPPASKPAVPAPTPAPTKK